MIVHPTRVAVDKKGAAMGVLSIWVFAVACACPNFIWREMEEHDVGLPGLESVAFCFEKWPIQYGRAYYSAFVLLIQFFFPIVTVSVAYFRISKKLSNRRRTSIRMRSKRSTRSLRCDGHDGNPQGPLNEFSMDTDSSNEMRTMGCAKIKKKNNEDQRVHKVNQLLIAITVVFCVSWLPLNLFNLVIDVVYPDHNVTEKMLVVYAACHLCGMSSACSNPFLYGWLNHNFRHEFSEMFLSAVWSRCVSAPRHRSVLRGGRANLARNNANELVVKDGSNHSPNPTPVSAVSQTMVTGTNHNTDTALEITNNGVVLEEDLIQQEDDCSEANSKLLARVWICTYYLSRSIDIKTMFPIKTFVLMSMQEVRNFKFM